MAKKVSGPRPTFDGKVMFPSEYVAAEDLAGDVAVEIESVKKASIRTEDGKMEKWVLRFKGAKKAMILNVTNAALIAQATGEREAKRWPGKRITLYATECEAFGRTVPCIRVRPVAPKPKQSAQPAPEQPFGDEGAITPFEEWAISIEQAEVARDRELVLERARQDERLTPDELARLESFAKGG